MNNASDSIAPNLLDQCPTKDHREELFRRIAHEMNRRSHTFADMVILLMQSVGVQPGPWNPPPRPGRTGGAAVASRAKIQASGEVKNP